MTSQKHCLLLVEDNQDDVFLMKRAMSKANPDLRMHVASDGQEALDYLAGVGNYADRASCPLPQCIFLDLKLPFVHGFEVLEWIRNRPSLAHITVFVLTSSPEDRDLQRAKELGAKAYLVKPPTPQMLLQVLESVL
ncbi:MAG: response regulator receiver protein [Pedosphaera sp.]|nr:response regulator receiver protein [Pedosphaera sp.]